MRGFAALSATALATVSFMPAAFASIDCNVKAYGGSTANIAPLESCLNSYNNSKWGDMNCGDFAWFKGERFYQSPDDCYAECYSCLNGSIHAAATSVECDNDVFLAACWIGYQ